MKRSSLPSTQVRPPLPYGIPINRFEWVLDRFTVIEQVKGDNVEDPPLPAPTRLNTVSLSNLDQEPRHMEFDILVVVVSCGAIKIVGIHGNKCRQIIVMDTNMHHCIFTLWEDFAEIDGSDLAAQIEEHPIILAKRIARSSYAGTSLTTRYNSVILINPSYPQAAELMNWAKENEEMLSTYTQRSSPEIASSPILISLNDEAIPIGNIQAQPAMQSFHVEGKISLLDDEQLFYELMCSKCKNFVRTKIMKAIDCVNCDQQAMLTPRCHFQVQITDGSGSTIATLVGEPGENLLSMKAEQIYEAINVKDTLQLPAVSTSTNTGESSKRELDKVATEKEQKKIIIGSTSSSKRQQTERRTPTKKTASSNKRKGIEPVTPTKKK
ncbi:replication protein A 70 kDa DNA-binding subunit B-like isoform X2 [Lycium barbarum]|uniref:replication protein A 70 kDa DNA-binding subunit B-like isoform X2 n=1 Tax=Lycium barbarum TaxID=112863 RepID=UPI00293F6D91|nr:replication protein A 70 kDa DNA-binding subunit B-like isoform X2 [Lycium barbarum]